MTTLTVSRSGAQGTSFTFLPYGWVTSSTLLLRRDGSAVDYDSGSGTVAGQGVFLSVGNSTYPPANTLFELFAEAESELSGYGYFIRTQYQYGLTPPPNVTVSGSSGAIDGGTGSFYALAEGGAATQYEWLFSAPAGTGNNPAVAFNSSGASAISDAHWFALPWQECPNSSSWYTIRARGLIDGSWYEGTAPYAVSLPDEAGRVENPIVSGSIVMLPNSDGTWRVSQNHLVRTQPILSIHLDAASQFYSKISQHENVHVAQFTSGLFANYWAPAIAYARVQNFSDTEDYRLLARVNADVTTYNQEQSALASPVMKSSGESQAYDVSDPIQPQFFYQRSCRPAF